MLETIQLQQILFADTHSWRTKWMLAGSVLHLNRKHLGSRKYRLCLDDVQRDCLNNLEPFYHSMPQLYRRAFHRQRLKDKLAAMTVLLKKGVAAQG